MDLRPNESIIYEGHPSWRSILGFYLMGVLVAAVLGAIAFAIDGLGLALAVFFVIESIVMVIGFIKRLFTVYTITSERLRIKRGIIARAVQQTDIGRVQNVNTNQSVLERILQVGTVDFDTAGTDDSEFRFAGVEDPEEVVAAVDRAQRTTQPV